jgi:phospholipid/cholesterol/gamma-HCH transport system ATP-binding protein
MIESKSLKKSFGGKPVLNGLDLTVERGETMVIIGRSGCGKSVFLKHVIGLIQADSGRLLIDGIDLSTLNGKQMNKLRLRFGMLFQGAALFDSMTVGENVGFNLIEHTNKSSKEILMRVDEALELVGLKGIQALRPSELSGGMKKRVALARAICMRPEILLYDEPTTGLDPVTSAAINELIVDLHDQFKMTAIAVTHDMVSAYRIATRVAMMYQGRILQVGTVDEIRNSKDPVVQQFINGLVKGPIADMSFREL